MRRDNLRVDIGLKLLESKNEWISVSELSYATGATARQIGAAVAQMNGADVRSEQAEWGKKLMLVADTDEEKRLWVFFMRWRYHVDNICDDLHGSIPYSGWISLHDLAEEHGMVQRDVIRTVSYLGDVSSKGTGKQIMFKRNG